MNSGNDDILFVEHALKRGLVTEEQVDEVLQIQEKVIEMGVPDAIPSLMVKRGLLQQKDADDILSVIRPKSRKEQIPGYHIIRRLGHGGMGSVYLARQTAMDRLVALKVLKPSLTKDPQQVERLRREAQYVGKLNHPNIIRGLDVGESGGFHFLAMEYVEGETLKERLKPGQYMRESEALKIVRAVAEALDDAWRSRIAHRDIKPGNIMLRTDGTALVMDYGLAKGPLDVSLTQTGSTLGTPQYLSPEQARNPREVDIRTDIYALGATLYHMLTGRPPFTGENLAEIVTQVLLKPPDPPQAINAKISGNAAFLIDRMMTKDPQHRYATPRELLRDLDAIEKGKSIVPVGWEGDWKAFVLKRRYRRLLTFSIAVFVLFVAMAVTMGVKWRQAEAEQHLENAANARIEAELQEGKGGHVTFENLETWRDSLAELHERYGDVERWFGDRLSVWDEALEAKGVVETAVNKNAALPSDHFAAKIANLEACRPVVEGRPVVEAHVDALIAGLRTRAAETALDRLDRIRKDAHLTLEDFERRLESLRDAFAGRWKETLPATTGQALRSDLRMTGVLLRRLKAADTACREELRVLAIPETEGRFHEAWTRVRQATEKVLSEEGVKEAIRGLPEHIRSRFTARLAEIPALVKDADVEACAALRERVAADLEEFPNDPGTFEVTIALLTSRAETALEPSRSTLAKLAGDLETAARDRREIAEKRYRETVAPGFREFLRWRHPENASLLLKKFREEKTPDGHALDPWVADPIAQAVGDLEAVREVWDRLRLRLGEQRGKTLDGLRDRNTRTAPKRTVIEVSGWTLKFRNEQGKEEELSLRDLTLDSALVNAGLSGTDLSPRDARLAGIVRWIEELENEEDLLKEIERLKKILALLPVDLAARHRDEVNARLVHRVEQQKTRESEARSLYEEACDLYEVKGKFDAARTRFELFHTLATYRNTKFYRDHKDKITTYINRCDSERKGKDLSRLPQFRGGEVHLFDDVDRITRNLARVSVTWPLDDDKERKALGLDDGRARIVTIPGVAPGDLPGPPAPGVAPSDAPIDRRVLLLIQGDDEKDLLEHHPFLIGNPFVTGDPMTIEFDLRSPRPLFLAISLAGCTCGILSQVDRVEGGQGVRFWLDKEITDLDQQRWKDLDALRRPNVKAAEAKAASPLEWLRLLETDYFHMLPDRWYRLRFTKGERIATLRVDGRVVGEWTFKTGSPPDPKRIVILTYTTTLLDNLRIEGTLDRTWLQGRGR